MTEDDHSIKRRKPISVGQQDDEEPAEEGGGPPPQRSGKPPGKFVAAVISWGIPAVLAIVGAVSIAVWLRREPQIPEVQPRQVSSQTTDAAPEETGETEDESRDTDAGREPDAEGAAPKQPRGGMPDETSGTGDSQQATTPASTQTKQTKQTATATAAEGQKAPSGAAVASNIPGKWPRFRGPNLDNISRESVSLTSQWGDGGPPQLWSVSLGEGYAGPAVRNGHVYVLDYDAKAKADDLRCFSLADGKELWSQSYPVVVKRNHGRSRTIPTVTDEYVLTLGPKCDVMCADPRDGSVNWRMDLVDDFGAEVPPWYAGQCPPVDNGRAILAPGGENALMIAVDMASGEVQWKTPNPHGWKMTHSSIMPAEFAGQRMYVYCASGGVVGVSASDGSILWETPKWTVSTANVPSPVPIGDGRIFLCGGYNAGAMMLHLKKQGGDIKPTVDYRLRPRTFGSDQHTPILYRGHIYGVIPTGELACLTLSGEQVWTSGRTNRFGLGPFVIADGKIIALTEDGELVLAGATSEAYQELARAKILDGPEAWAPMAPVSGRLLARDRDTMVCLDLRG